MKMLSDFKIFVKEIKLLIISPFFFYLTIFGNTFIISCGLLFYHLEVGINPKINRYIDAIWWSFTTATTTGYGDITPVTDIGKILSILLMITGLLLFAVFTAMFAETILASRNALEGKNKPKD